MLSDGQPKCIEPMQTNRLSKAGTEVSIASQVFRWACALRPLRQDDLHYDAG